MIGEIIGGEEEDMIIGITVITGILNGVANRVINKIIEKKIRLKTTRNYFLLICLLIYVIVI